MGSSVVCIYAEKSAHFCTWFDNSKKRGTQLINVPTYDVKKKDAINSDVLKNFTVLLHKKN